VVRDITEQKLAEDELKRYQEHLEELVTVRTAELAAANQELEAFSYTVSHDLRAPLRALNNYSLFIQEDCAGVLDGDCLEYVQGIAESAQQMERLVLDLLDYSRINRVKVMVGDVDTGDLLAELATRLQLHEYAALSLPSDLPTVRAKKVRLEQIFSNLLTNAVKFRRVDTPLAIAITWSEQPDYWTFSVQDNGIGIDEKYNEKIFGIFQRLHTQEEYEGTGIGLAIVDKAVKEHLGQVRVQSQLGVGSTFTFTISKKIHEE
jgi:light-regulated signal transduction histidine kinase (bacteriophytochrome)